MDDLRVGLTLGKYAPLHAGHQHVIETAAAETEHLVVVVYPAPSHTSVPLSVRAGWLRELYPGVEVIEAVEGPEETGTSPEIVRLQNDYLKALLQSRKIDAFYSSEAYGASVAEGLGCANRLVDPTRSIHRVSGTAIRAAFAALAARPAAGVSPAAGISPAAGVSPAAGAPRGALAGGLSTEERLITDALDPRVRGDLIPRIVLLGGPSTGKTTTALALGKLLGEPVCLEYGREYWFEHQVDHRLSMQDLESIASEQVRREREAAGAARHHLVADTSPLTTYSYALYYFGRASAKLAEVAATYHSQDRLLVLCDTDIPFADSWDRSGPGSREKLQEINRAELASRGLSYVLASGTPEERVETIVEALGAWRYRC